MNDETCRENLANHWACEKKISTHLPRRPNKGPYQFVSAARVNTLRYSRVSYRYEDCLCSRPTLQETLRDLAVLAKDGNDESLQSLIEHAAPLVHRWAVVQLGDFDVADDVTQDVMIKMVKSLAKMRTPEHIQSWLFRTTRNTALSHIRKQRVHLENRSSTATKLASSISGPDERFENTELNQRLVSLLQELPRRQREIFDLIELQGISPTQVAKMLRVLPATVRVHLFKARVTLRRRLTELGIRQDA